MAWPTKFSKTQITEALDRGQQDRVVNNGWIRLNSSTSSPTYLGGLVETGNYITSYWTDGPSLGSDAISPANIVVTLIDGTLHQFINAGEKKFHRAMSSESNMYGAWDMPAIEGATNPGPTAPVAPVSGETLWLDTTNSDVPSLKVYIDGGWKEIIPAGSMKIDIYDPERKQTDIFKYIDDAIVEASIDASMATFKSHIDNTDIHVSTAEKEKWNNTPSEADINEAITTLENSMQNITDGIISDNLNNVETLLTETNALYEEVITHDNVSSIHPSAEKQAQWDNKSDAEHTHHLDDAVVVDISNIVGEISTNALPFNVKERFYSIESRDQLAALTKNPVHNGDIVCVEGHITGETPKFYMVINDNYLGTGYLELAFKEIVMGDGKINWKSVIDEPTTLAGYGITDAVSKTDVNELSTYLDTVEENIPNYSYNSAASIKSYYENALEDLATLDAQLGTLIEEPTAALEAMVLDM